MSDADRVVRTSTSSLLPGKGNEAHCRVPRAMPSVTILVHGVNDVGEAYRAQEKGLCQGLNERLDRTDLVPAEYTHPNPDRVKRQLTEEPDLIYHQRRADSKTSSPIIPFYWGFREEEAEIRKGEKHGEWLDRHGNRLDKRGAKSGGPFLNFTASVPDMWGKGASGRVLYIPLEALKSDPTHPLLRAPERSYFLLAARRLAMLIRVIRRYAPDDTVNVIGHSQGTMVALLAQAFLHDEGERAADCLILNNSVYSLAWTFVMGIDSGLRLQTVRARLDTLVNIVDFVCTKPHQTPAWGDLSDATKCNGLTGPLWRERKKLIESETFCDVPERDNRGKVYLYFSPDDHSTAMDSCASIGWQGVPDDLYVEEPGRGAGSRRVKPLERLGARFKQRVWRAPAHGEEVGKPPTSSYEMVGVSGDHLRQGINPRETRTISGEALVPTCTPEIDFGGTKQIDGRGTKRQERQQPVGAVDAYIAITRPKTAKEYDPEFFVTYCGLSGEDAYRETKMADWRPKELWQRHRLDDEQLTLAQERWNSSKEPNANQSTLLMGSEFTGDGWIDLKRMESPNETALRYLRHAVEENSYHSGIVANPKHHRQVTAYDLAIGQAKSIDDPDRLNFLLHVANWRTDWSRLQCSDEPEVTKLFDALLGPEKSLVDGTSEYYRSGRLPDAVQGNGARQLPSLVVSETEADIAETRRNELDRSG